MQSGLRATGKGIIAGHRSAANGESDAKRYSRYHWSGRTRCCCRCLWCYGDTLAPQPTTYTVLCCCLYVSNWSGEIAIERCRASELKMKRASCDLPAFAVNIMN